MDMVHLKENEIVITPKADEPAQKLTELQDGLIYILKDYFAHIGNEVDSDCSAAYNDLSGLLKATMPSATQLQLISNKQH
jgi:hypothetical protein